MKKLLFLSVALFFSTIALSQNKKEMEPAKEKRTYNTSGMEKKKVGETFEHNNKEEVKVISRKTFESYPPEKRQAILSEPEKYIIED